MLVCGAGGGGYLAFTLEGSGYNTFGKYSHNLLFGLILNIKQNNSDAHVCFPCYHLNRSYYKIEDFCFIQGDS